MTRTIGLSGLALLAVCGCGSAGNDDPFQGSPDVAEATQSVQSGIPFVAPYSVQVEVQYPFEGVVYSAFCTASILTPRWILTAAHCLRQPIDETTILSPASVVVHRQISPDSQASEEIYRGPATSFVPSTFVPDGEMHPDDVGMIKLEGVGLSPRPRSPAVLYSDSPDRLVSYLGTRGARVDGWGLGTNAPDQGCGITFEDLAPRNGALSIPSITNGTVNALLDRGSQTCSGDSGAPWSAAFGRTRATFGLTRGNPTGVSSCEGACYVAGETVYGPFLAPWIDWMVHTARVEGQPIRCSASKIKGDDGRQYRVRACSDGCDD